ncbi:unnamed protein product [Gordionus sp. m RMFG-2023]
MIINYSFQTPIMDGSGNYSDYTGYQQVERIVEYNAICKYEPKDNPCSIENIGFCPTPNVICIVVIYMAPIKKNINSELLILKQYVSDLYQENGEPYPPSSNIWFFKEKKRHRLQGSRMTSLGNNHATMRILLGRLQKQNPGLKE